MKLEAAARWVAWVLLCLVVGTYTAVVVSFGADRDWRMFLVGVCLGAPQWRAVVVLVPWSSEWSN